MKIWAISDLHLDLTNSKPMDVFGGAWENYQQKIRADWQEKVADEDVVVVAGDISWAMKLEDFKEDLVFFDGLKGNIVFLRGNHDYWFSSKTKTKSVLKENMHFVSKDAIKIKDTIFCGTRGWEIPTFKTDVKDKKIFEREKIRLTLAFEEAKKLQTNNEKIILLMHYPPYLANNTQTEIVEIINKFKPDAVIFGHLHNSLCGLEIIKKIDNIPYYLTSCDLLDNKLIEIKP